MIWYIYFTAVGLTPGGSSTSHIYTQTVHLHTNSMHNTEIGKLGSAGRAPSCELYPGICLTTGEKAWKNLRKKHGKTWKKHGKTSWWWYTYVIICSVFEPSRPRCTQAVPTAPLCPTIWYKLSTALSLYQTSRWPRLKILMSSGSKKWIQLYCPFICIKSRQANPLQVPRYTCVPRDLTFSNTVFHF
jgi:hypothetical protein